MKPRVIRIHFNRIAMQRGDPRVWSIQMSDRCLHARHVVFNVPVRSMFKPEKKDNPRAFFECKGYVHWIGATQIASIRATP